MLRVTFDAPDPARLARFWAGMLGREVVQDAGGVLLPGDDVQVGLRFAPGRSQRQDLQRRLHLHLHQCRRR